MTPVLLLTRPEAASRRFAADWAAGCAVPGLRIVIAPLQRIEAVAHDAAALAAAEALVFTSPVAVPFAGPGRGRIAICVGPGTAAAATTAGFAVQVSPTGEAGGMLPLIAAHRGRLVHPHGRHLARELPAEGVIVYDQVAQPLGEGGRALLAGTAPVIVPLFSPRSARLAAEAARDARAPLLPVAISEAAAANWSALRPETPRVAVRPDAAAMSEVIAAVAMDHPPLPA